VRGLEIRLKAEYLMEIQMGNTSSLDEVSPNFEEVYKEIKFYYLNY
jgi:hypothetical protein